MGIFSKTQNTPNTLTAAEVSALWLQYLGDSMSICVYKYFLAIVENKEIKPILEEALKLSENHVKKITQFLKRANFQIPTGFTEHDVNVNAPRLFSDQFLLFYSYKMTIHGLTAYSLAITNAERQDIQNFFLNARKHRRNCSKKLWNWLKRSRNLQVYLPSLPLMWRSLSVTRIH